MRDNRQSLNLIGGGFRHSPSTSGYDALYVKWDKTNFQSPISIHVDKDIQTLPNPDKINYGWLCESKTIQPGMYEWCKNNIEYLIQHFNKVFTHDVSLASIHNIFQLTQCSGKSFIEIGQVYPKTKLVSMIASNKTQCEAHRYRQKVISKFSQKCDLYGRGHNPIDDKAVGLKDYCFSITMENATYSNMFTEKITDCFMTGTIPIYYGIPNIGDFFNTEGIIVLNDDFNIEDLSFDLYHSKIEAVKENYRLANELLTAEDFIYTNFIKNDL